MVWWIRRNPVNPHDIMKDVTPPVTYQAIMEKNMPENQRYIPKGFQQKKEPFTIKVEEDTYVFVDRFDVKGPMTEEEQATFHNALSNYMLEMITLDELKATAYPLMDETLSEDQKYAQLNKMLSDYQKEKAEIINKVPRLGLTPDGSTHGMSHYPDGTPRVLPQEERANEADLLEEMTDAINHPSHYTHYKGLEVIDITEQLNFNRGNAIKYIARAGFKSEDTETQDLKKAKWYVEREISRLTDGGSEYENTADAESLVEQMNYNRGTAVAAIAHAGTGDHRTITTALYKAVRYLDRELSRLEQYKEN